MTKSLSRLDAGETAGVVADVVLPLLARGAIVRRRRVTGFLDRVDADRRAVRRLQRLRTRHGDGPVLMQLPGRTVVVVLHPKDVRRVLEGTPKPFTPANVEKVAALSRFQPHGVLISKRREREERRRFNEEVLDAGRATHRLAPEVVGKVSEEAERLVENRGRIGWDAFAASWWRVVRRIVLGDGAREDTAVTDLLEKLRADANWAYLKPKRRALRERFLRRLDAYVEHAEPGSLAALVASAPASAVTYPVEQIPHWLFAFDAAGITTWRALALLDAHPDERAQALADAEPELAFTRACLLETVRLWPTTPVVMRDATEDVEWEDGTIPAGAGVLIFAPFFHRDGERLPHADTFRPDRWLDEGRERAALIPFSAGPAACPGRNLVLLATSALLRTLLAAGVGRADPALHPGSPLPATLSPFRLSFDVVG